MDPLRNFQVRPDVKLQWMPLDGRHLMQYSAICQALSVFQSVV